MGVKFHYCWAWWQCEVDHIFHAEAFLLTRLMLSTPARPRFTAVSARFCPAGARIHWLSPRRCAIVHRHWWSNARISPWRRFLLLRVSLTPSCKKYKRSLLDTCNLMHLRNKWKKKSLKNLNTWCWREKNILVWNLWVLPHDPTSLHSLWFTLLFRSLSHLLESKHHPFYPCCLLYQWWMFKCEQAKNTLKKWAHVWSTEC